MTPEQAVERALARAKEARAAHGIQTDGERLTALPKQDFLTNAASLVAKWTVRFQRGDTCTMPLRPVQAAMLEVCQWAADLDAPVGAFLNVGVGMGKTLFSMLAPEIFNAKRPLLLVPASMRGQLEGDFFEWSKHYKFRLRYSNVVYYSELSRPEATALLKDYDPDLIILDEGHLLRHATAARTKRFIRYLRENPDTRVVVMSGTLTTTGICDYAHLAEIALRQYSPLPSHDKDIDMMGSVINAGGEPDEKAWDSVAWLSLEAAGSRHVGRMRMAFQKHFSESAGVLVTRTSSCDAGLVLRPVYPKLSDEVRWHLLNMKDDYVLPNGDDIVDALHFHRAMGQLSCGFYYVWDWPGDPDEEWMDARKMWGGACRQYLARYAREGCDSPFLVEDYVRKSQRPRELYQALMAWDEQREKDPPPTKAIWMDPSPVLFAVEWARKQDRAFLWYTSRAVGDLLEALGVPRFDSGKDTPDPNKHPVAALSTAVYNKGRNFQAWSKQLVLEPVSNAGTWEQLLGRTHRHGQQAEVVECDIFQHTWANKARLATATDRAHYIHQSQGQPQKLLEARRTK